MERMISDFRLSTEEWRKRQFDKLRQCEGKDIDQQIQKIQKEEDEIKKSHSMILEEMKSSIEQSQKSISGIMKKYTNRTEYMKEL